MVYTEIKERNKRKYYYRAMSIREGSKIGKRRVYLGVNLNKKRLVNKEVEADKKILTDKINNSLKKIIPRIIKVLKKYHIKKAGVFGSYARGEQKKGSDIDIIVEPPKKMGIEFIKLNYDLEDSLREKVDLITYNGINSRIKKYILKDEKRII